MSFFIAIHRLTDTGTSIHCWGRTRRGWGGVHSAEDGHRLYVRFRMCHGCDQYVTLLWQPIDSATHLPSQLYPFTNAVSRSASGANKNRLLIHEDALDLDTIVQFNLGNVIKE